MKRKLGLLCGIIVLSLFSFGQKTTSTSVPSDSTKENKLIEADLFESSEPEEAFFNITKQTKSLVIMVKTTLKNGRFKIEIYDPKGEKYHSDLLIDSQIHFGNVIKLPHKNSSKETASNKTSLSPKTIAGFGIVIRKPQSGKWKIIMLPEEANGNIQINYSVVLK